MLSSLFYFLLALLILVSVHEAGHFFAARWCGVKVQKFSFGFGPVLFSKQDKKGTTFAFSMIPLGGYVKLLDEAHTNVSSDERHLAFNTKPAWARAWIVFAGPLVNFILAFLLFWVVAVIGMPVLSPIVGEVVPNSLAEHVGFQAQDEWVSVNGKKVSSWQDVRFALIPFAGESTSLEVVVNTKEGHAQHVIHLPVGRWLEPSRSTDLLTSLGVMPLLPKLSMRVGEVFENTPASRAGLKVGDEILAVNGQTIGDWHTLIRYIKAHPSALMVLTVMRAEQEQYIEVQLSGGALGIQSEMPSWPKGLLHIARDTPIAAFYTAYKKVYFFTASTIRAMGKMLVGELPLKHLSGPVGIAEGAGQSAHSGVVYYLSFLGIISIGLGLLNLLPIPMLDGGQLLFIGIEKLIGRPLSDQVKAVSVSLGLLILMGLMAVALRNDLIRLTGIES